MAQKKKPGNENQFLPHLLETREDAKQKIASRIEKGIELYNQIIHNQSMLTNARHLRDKWSEYNSELLSRLFDNESIANEYDSAGRGLGIVYFAEKSFADTVETFKDGLTDKINKLESIHERLDLIPENFPSKSISSSPLPLLNTSDVFIVHGQDDGAKETLARLLSKMDLNPVILHEQANEGKTIIEKFESHASAVNFAVVLLTPDDVGHIKDKPELAKPRARQNVIFELGYFIGKLSRKHVCALYKEGVELPSDYQGVLFIPMDSGGAWKFMLAKELRTAGYDVDMNKLS